MLAFLSWPDPRPDDDLHTWQRGRCAMCERKLILVLDHDHASGLTRGYLCHRCNNLEATSTAPEFARWRDGCNPARLHGWEEPFTGRGWQDGQEVAARLGAPTAEDLQRAINGLSLP